ncbi:hypothetical protein V6N13_103698 [Hibiscus sabdariffa]
MLIGFHLNVQALLLIIMKRNIKKVESRTCKRNMRTWQQIWWKSNFMDANNWRPTPPSGENTMDGGDWRTILQPDSRQRIFNKM